MTPPKTPLADTVAEPIIPAPAATLDDLAARVGGESAPADPAAAVRALGTGADPVDESPPRNKGGRPKGARNKPKDGADAPAPGAPASRPRSGSKRTNAELEAENQAYKARLDQQATTATYISPDDLRRASETVQGIFAIGNMVAEAAKAPEFAYSESERATLGDAFAAPMAPYLAKLGGYQPWVVAVGTLAMLTWPKWQAYQDRRELESKTAIPIGPQGTPAVGDRRPGDPLPQRPGVDIPTVAIR